MNYFALRLSKKLKDKEAFAKRLLVCFPQQGMPVRLERVNFSLVKLMIRPQSYV